MKKRTTLGLLIDWVAMPFHTAIMNAVADVCEERDWHLICFVTGQLGSHRITEQCRNLLAELATSEVIDALLVSASTLEATAGHDHLAQMLRQYQDLPVVTLHDAFAGIPAVAADNAAGARMVLEHLLQVHGYRRLAFVAGKQGRHDFDERRVEWQRFVTEHRLPSSDHLNFQGDFGPESGIEAVNTLLPYRGEFDAVVFANDAMALGAQQELARLGVEPFPLVGFDDSTQASTSQMTTVRQSLFDQVRTATDLLWRSLEGEEIPPQTRETPKLVVRSSCGCSGASSSAASASQPVRVGIDYSVPLSERELDDLYDLGETMFSTLNREDEIKRAIFQFARFGVDACCLNLYDSDTEPLATSHLGVAYDGARRFELEGNGLQFATRALWPPGVLDLTRRRSLMLQALFCGAEQIGFVVFSIQTRKWRVYEMLRRELSLALKGSTLVREAWGQTGELERRVRARTTELEVANLALKDQFEEKARIEAELTRREARYRELITKSPALVLELDDQLRPAFINQTGLDLLGLESLEGRRGVGFLTYVHPDDAGVLEDKLRLVLEGPEPVTGEFRLQGAHGKTASVVFEANSFAGKGGLRSVRLSGVNVSTLFAHVARPEEALFEHYSFSPRARQVLELMLSGQSIKDMALRLGVSENTIKTHVRRIYIEVGVTSRNGLFKILREYQVHHFGHQSYVFSMLSTLIRE